MNLNRFLNTVTGGNRGAQMVVGGAMAGLMVLSGVSGNNQALADGGNWGNVLNTGGRLPVNQILRNPQNAGSVLGNWGQRQVQRVQRNAAQEASNEINDRIQNRGQPQGNQAPQGQSPQGQYQPQPGANNLPNAQGQFNQAAPQAGGPQIQILPVHLKDAKYTADQQLTYSSSAIDETRDGSPNIQEAYAYGRQVTGAVRAGTGILSLTGNRDVVAPASGKIVHINTDRNGQGSVMIAHTGNAYTYFNSIEPGSLKVGDQIQKGQAIGETGADGFYEQQLLTWHGEPRDMALRAIDIRTVGLQGQVDLRQLDDPQVRLDLIGRSNQLGQIALNDKPYNNLYIQSGTLKDAALSATPLGSRAEAVHKMNQDRYGRGPGQEHVEAVPFGQRTENQGAGPTRPQKVIFGTGLRP